MYNITYHFNYRTYRSSQQKGKLATCTNDQTVVVSHVIIFYEYMQCHQLLITTVSLRLNFHFLNSSRGCSKKEVFILYKRYLVLKAANKQDFKAKFECKRSTRMA